MRCDNCDRFIDTDFDSEHFEECQAVSNLKRDIEDYTHYHRTCQNCGKNWWGLHCPHDGYQNPCPECEFKPKPLRDKHCDCEFVVPVPEIIDLIESVVDEIIGKDESPKSIPFANTRLLKTEQDIIKVHRNNLRQKQRDIKSKLIGKE